MTPEARRAARAAKKASNNSSLIDQLRAAVGDGLRFAPSAGRSVERLTLPGGAVVQLTSKDGDLTEYGAAYEEQVPGGLDLWERDRGTEEAPQGTYGHHRAKGRVRIRTRRRNLATGVVGLVPTKIGQSFYKTNKWEFLVSVPVIQTYRRWFGRVDSYAADRDGVPHRIHLDHTQLERLIDPGSLQPRAGATQAQIDQAIRDAVLAYVADTPVLADFTQSEVWCTHNPD